MATILWNLGIAAILIGVPAALALSIYRYLRPQRRHGRWTNTWYAIGMAAAALYWVVLLALVFYPGVVGQNPVTQTLALEGLMLVALPVAVILLFRWARRSLRNRAPEQ